jgi:hypothetical protein
MNSMLVICFACLAIAGSNALAEPAVLLKVEDLAGTAIDGDGNIVVISCDSMLVETNSETGVITSSCRTKGIPNSSGQAVKYDIYNNPIYWQLGILVPCAVFTADGTLHLTEDWTETVSASGNLVFRCKVKND